MRFGPTFLLVTLVLSGFAATAPRASAAESIRVEKVTLQCAGVPIRAEVFEQPGQKRRPVVLVLHGAGGILLDGPEMRRMARHLAEQGNAAYVLHYFERTHSLFGTDAMMQRHFPEWLETVRASIPAIQTLRGDAAPVGIFGYSLGGFLSVLAASDNPRVAAVVEHAGGVWNSRMERVGKMPAVLMVHGRRDARVPFEKYAAPLLAVLKKRATTVETRFFAEEGHGFTPAGLIEVRTAAAKFFHQHLPSR